MTSFAWVKVSWIEENGKSRNEPVWSHTPEEFVEELRRRGEKVQVTRGSCKECAFAPERFATHEATQEFVQESLAFSHRIPECQVCARGRRWKWIDGNSVPDFLVCYGFYYQYWHQNRWLKAAQEADLIEFYDITGLPGCRESGGSFISFL